MHNIIDVVDILIRIIHDINYLFQKLDNQVVLQLVQEYIQQM